MKIYIRSSETGYTRSEWDLINDNDAKVRWEVAKSTDDPDILEN